MIFRKDPDATLDYTFDWSKWLDDDEISTYEVIVPTGLALDEDAGDATKVTAWISGGEVGERYTVTCRITTINNPERIDERSVTFLISDR